MILDLLLVSNLSRFNLTGEQVHKQVESIKVETQVSAEEQADPLIRVPSNGDIELAVLDKGKVLIIKGESKAEKVERERREAEERAKIEAQRILAQRVSKYQSYNKNANYGTYTGSDVEIVGYYSGQCYSYVVSQGKPLPTGYGTAGNLPAEKREPQVGDAVVTYEGWVGHVALVTQVDGDYIKIKEANYRAGAVTMRTLNWQSGIIKGFL